MMSRPHVKPPKIGKCQLLGPVSIIIQSIMGLLIIMVLLLKRTYESPKRTMTVWLYDIIKQLGGSLVIHLLNIMLSIWKHDDVTFCIRDDGTPVNGGDNDDECDWYFVNLLMDTTMGIPILYYILHGLETIGTRYNISNIKSGDYFSDKAIGQVGEDVTTSQHLECGGVKYLHSPHKHYHHHHPKFQAFLKQFLIFLMGLIIMKFIIYIILNYMEPLAYGLANLVIGWSDPWPNFQVFLVMFICPVLLNCFQYVCVDNIIKLHDTNVNPENLDSFEPTSEEQAMGEEQPEEDEYSSSNVQIQETRSLPRLDVTDYGTMKTGTS